MANGTIYYLINSVNNKVYVGKTSTSIKQRWKEHCTATRNKSQHAIHRAMRKHGIEKFQIKTLSENVPSEELNKMEIIWIILMNSLPPNGYNMTQGGQGGSPTDAVREKIIKNITERWSDPELRAKYLEIMRQPERRKKISTGNKKASTDPETKQRRSEAAKKKWEDEEFRKKLSEIHLKNWQDPEYRAKILASREGSQSTPKAKSSRSAIMKKLWENEEFRKKMSKRKKGKQNPDNMKILWADPNGIFNSPEFRAKLSLPRKKRKSN